MKRKKAPKPPHIYLIAAAKKTWYWSSERRMAIQLASVGPDRIRCAGCQEILPKKLKINGRLMWQVDHIDPVGPGPTSVTSTSSWATFYSRLFVPVDNLQILCTVCHQLKTNKENAARRKKKAS